MKPRTKLQKEIISLKSRLPVITQRKKQWVQGRDFCGTYIRAYSSNYCLECGHKWKSTNSALSHKLVGETCPNCHKDVRLYKFEWKGSTTEYTYWASIHKVQDYQVVRMIRVRKFMKRGQPAQYDHQEVMQHWITPVGIMVTLAGLCQGMGHYYDSWIPGSEIEVRTESDSHFMRQAIIPDEVYPGYYLQPDLTRNGFQGEFYGVAPHYLFGAILKNPKAETLLKAGQIELFKLCCKSESCTNYKIEEYWPSICIAIRNEYFVDDPSDWLDYIQMLQSLGRDIRNPRLICPDNLHKVHQAANKKLMQIRMKKAKAQQYKEMKQVNDAYIKDKAAFFGLCFSVGDFTFTALSSVHEFKEEGNELKHCIYTNKYYQKRNCLLLSARIDGRRVETVEVNLPQMQVTQARGYQNKATEHHDEIVKAVHNHLHLIDERYRSALTKTGS